MLFPKYDTAYGVSMTELVKADDDRDQKMMVLDTTFKGLKVFEGKTDTVRLGMEDDNGNQHEFDMYWEGFDYLCYRLRMPKGYFNRCPARLAVPHFDHWIDEITDRPLRIFVVNGSVIAVVTDRYAYIPNLNVIEAINGIPNVKVNRWSYSPALMTANVTADNRTPQSVQSIRKGDEAVLGMTISNSDTGWGQLTCYGRVDLSNGGWMVMPGRFGGFKKRHQGDPDNLWEEFNEVWDDLTKNFAEVAKRLKAMAKEKVTALEEEGIVGQIVTLLKLPVQKTVEALSTEDKTTTLDILDRLLKLADDPDYADHADKIRRAAGEWVVTDDPNNPLWVTV